MNNRIAFVTGASSGLGLNFSKVLASAGYTVVLSGRRLERLNALQSEIEITGGKAHVVELDITSAKSITNAVDHVEAKVGAIDVLVNNSGVSSTQRLVDVTPTEFKGLGHQHRGHLLYVD